MDKFLLQIDKPTKFSSFIKEDGELDSEDETEELISLNEIDNSGLGISILSNHKILPLSTTSSLDLEALDKDNISITKNKNC